MYNKNGMMAAGPNLVQALKGGNTQRPQELMKGGTPEQQQQAMEAFQNYQNAQSIAGSLAGMQNSANQGSQPAMRVFSPEEQQMMSQRLQNLMAQSPGQRAPSQPMRNAAMQTPPFFNPPPQMPPMPGGSFFQNMAAPSMQQQPQQPQMQAPAQSANAPFGRERQSPGVYKDPKTGALYGQNGKLLRPGSKRMR